MTVASAVAPALTARPKRKAQAAYLVAYQPRHPSFIADSYVFAETMSAYHKRRPGHQWRARVQPLRQLRRDAAFPPGHAGAGRASAVDD